MDDKDNPKSIDLAIVSLSEELNEHRSDCKKMLTLTWVFAALIGFLVASPFIFAKSIADNFYNGQLAAEMVKQLKDPTAPTERIRNEYVIEPSTLKVGLLVFSGLFVLVFGVLMSIYRHHLGEISRIQQQRLGLLRIRIAANNFALEGFQSEVRQSLTTGAFDPQKRKERKVESPLPGHPTSDLSAIIMNKLLDSVRIDIKQKENGDKR